MKSPKAKAIAFVMTASATFILFQNATQSYQTVDVSTDVRNVSAFNMNIEFRGNESNGKAFYDPLDPNVSQLPVGYFQNHYPLFKSVRLGNTFFGYECFKNTVVDPAVDISVAKKDAYGNITYNFDQLKGYYREMLRAGVYPLVTLTGFPKDLYLPNTHIYSRDAYGCTTVPPINFTKLLPKERMPQFAKLLREYFRALKADPVLGPSLSKWNFATWAEPFSRMARDENGNLKADQYGHLIMDHATQDRYAAWAGVPNDRSDVFLEEVQVEAIATLIATTISVAMDEGVSIHLGNFAGNPEELQKVMTRIQQFSNGSAIADYAKAASFSKYSLVSEPTGKVAGMIHMIRKFNSDVPYNETYINELGIKGFDQDDDVWESEPSLWGGIYFARALENVFNLYNPAQRSITKINFWHDNLFFLPRNFERSLRFDDYLKKPAFHAMNFFSQLKGLRRLSMTSTEPERIGLVGGRFEKTLNSRFIVFNEGVYEDTFDVSTRDSKTRIVRFRIGGFPGLKDYSVTVQKVDRNFGNPVKDFFGVDFNYRKSLDLEYNSVQKKYLPVRDLLAKFDSAEFFKQARKSDDPFMRSVLTKSSVDGTLEVSVILGPNEMAYIDVQLVPPVDVMCTKANSVSLGFRNSLSEKQFAPLLAKSLSLDDGYNWAHPGLQSEKSRGVRFFSDASLVYPCSFLQPGSGTAALQFKISSGEALLQTEQVLLSAMSADLRNGHQLRLINGSIVASITIDGSVYSAFYVMQPADYDKWNRVQLAWFNSKLQLRVNRVLQPEVTLTRIPALSNWNFKLEVGQAAQQKIYQGLLDSITLGEFTGSAEDELSASMPTDPGYDIVVVAGQSNAIGYGQLPAFEAPELLGLTEDPTHPCSRVCQLGRAGVNEHTSVEDLKVLPAVNPLDHVNSGKIGFAMTYAKRLSTLLPANRKVLIVPVALGGTSILYWSPGVKTFDKEGREIFLYNNMISRVNSALQMEGKSNRIVAFLWQQGEADIKIASSPNHALHASMPNEDVYYQKLTRLHTNLRRDLPNTNCFPILMGLPSPDWVNSIKARFESKIMQVANEQNCTGLIPATGLRSNAALDGVIEDGEDTEHFSGQSQINLGEKYFSLFLQNFW